MTEAEVVKARIVVGVDGSEGSNAALAWAQEEAILRGATLVVVHTWSFPYVGDMAYSQYYSGEAVEEDARTVLDGALERSGVLEAGLEIERHVVQGPAAQVLIEQGKGADLIVVGSRGRGGFAGLLLGSVSQQVAHHATSPVAIIPASAA
jgi:nucleotide-binding universal stress UspA family protein